MKTRRFELFTEMIGCVPAKAVLRAIELEEWMVKDDLLNHRDLLFGDASSILTFSHFLHAVKAGEPFPPGTLPSEHIPVYQEIVKRLMDTGDLPYSAQQQFEEVFQNSFLRQLAA
jgi:hypothetical protein